jgi:transglutaminase-like putative cysteine protease
MCRRAVAVAAFVGMLGWGFAAGAREAAPWRIEPAPRWVIAPPPPSDARAGSDESALEYPLDDTQVRVSDRTVEHYRHIRFRPRSPKQLEEGSQVELEFNPAYERLIIHHAVVERDGRPLAALRARDVKIVQREKDLDARIYDGSLSALIFLRDVRVGDVVDYAYTVEGASPILEGKYVTTFQVADDTFTARWRRRILFPPARSLTVKAHGTDVSPTITSEGGFRVYTWEGRDAAPVEREDGLPEWFSPEPWVEASEFGSWREVVALFEGVYLRREAPGPDLTAEIAKLRALAGSDEDRLLEATRFVQDDIRYLGIELGLGGAQPFAPSVVLQRRFGDCKDKSVLLVTLLRALGFDARPALVNTRRTRELDEALPSPRIFDHAIVHVTIGARSVFIDPTETYQRGPLAERDPPDYERALIIAPGSKGLVPIPRPALADPTLTMRETFTVHPGDGGADLEVETTLRRDDADRMREKLASRSRKEIGRDYLNYYSRRDPSVTQLAELEAVDDARRNVMVVRERYRFGAFWRQGERELDASTIDDLLSTPHIRLRRAPYAPRYPANAVHETVVHLPSAPDVEAETSDISDDHVRFHFEARVAGKELRIRYELQALADSVAPDKAERYFQTVDVIRARAGYVLRQSAAAQKQESPFSSPFAIVGVVVFAVVPLLGVVAGVRAGWRWSRRRRTRAQRRLTAGEAAATAIAVSFEHDVDGRVTARYCACGGSYEPGPRERDQRVRYDGRTLLVREAICRACATPRSFYFSVGEGAAEN